MAGYAKSICNYFYPERKKHTLLDDLIKDLMKDIGEITEYAFPEIEKELAKRLNDSRIELKSHLTEQNVKSFINTTISKMDDVYGELLTTCDKNNKLKDGVKKAIENNKLKLQMLTTDLSDIEAKKTLATTYSKLISSKKKRIKIVGLGNSQQGKTSTLKYLFQIGDDKLKINKNLGSDTNTITEYSMIKYGIELIYVDCPGTSDSRGKEQDIANRKIIIDYFKNNNDVDIIFWVSKLDRIVDMSQQETIELLGKQIINIWEKTIVILTCSNSSAIPDSYFENTDMKINDEDEELIAWKKYTNDKIKMWRNHFHKYNTEMSVCLVENSKRYVKEVNDVFILKDGTPFWEILMYEVFRLIDSDKAPISFLAMLNTTDQKSKDIVQHEKVINNAMDRLLDQAFNEINNTEVPNKPTIEKFDVAPPLDNETTKRKNRKNFTITCALL